MSPENLTIKYTYINGKKCLVHQNCSKNIWKVPLHWSETVLKFFCLINIASDLAGNQPEDYDKNSIYLTDFKASNSNI